MCDETYVLRIKQRYIYIFFTKYDKSVTVLFSNWTGRLKIVFDWHLLIIIYRNIINNKKNLNSYYQYTTNYLINELRKEALKFSTIENVIDALEIYPEVIKFLDLSYTANKEFMLKVVSNNGKLLCYASVGLKSDKDVVYAALNNDGFALRYVPLKLKSDIDVVRIAVLQNGMALKYASIEMKADIEIVWLAVKQNRDAFKYASIELKMQKNLILPFRNNCITNIITETINKSNTNLTYRRYIRSNIKKYYNKNIFNIIRHLYSIKYFLIGSNNQNPILKSNLLKIHSHGQYHAIKFKRQILSYLSMMNDSIQILLYDIDDKYSTIPFYILLKSIF